MRIVIKVGSNVLAGKDNKIDVSRVNDLTGQILNLREAGHEIIVVSSGAVAAGRSLTLKSAAHLNKAVLASIGQPYLVSLFNAAYQKEPSFGQFLLSRNDFADRDRYDQTVKALELAIQSRIIPLLNENDVLATPASTLGDNDILSAITAIAANASKLIILTSIEGLFTENPNRAGAKLISEVANVDLQLERLCKQGTSTLGTGGMLSKVRAAKHAKGAGIETHIADGKEKHILDKIMIGENVGTKFLASKPEKISAHARWILAAKGFGLILIDDGAAMALVKKKSLLLPGILQVKGSFNKNDIVEIISKSGLTVAYGKSNFTSSEIQTAVALRKRDSSFTINKEVIHRDYMVNAQTI
jgi:glutamate 5-kinase